MTKRQKPERRQETLSLQQMLPFMFMQKLHDSEPEVVRDEKFLKATLSAGVEAARPVYSAWERLLKYFIPFPKALISGFSCHVCPRCETAEPLTPIKDLGIDLTAEGRHQCQSFFKALNNTSSMTETQKSNLDQLTSGALQALAWNINKWIPGQKIIRAILIKVARKEDDSITKKRIEKQFDIPKKYHLEQVDDFNRSPWLKRLMRIRRVEPDLQESQDFCAYCWVLMLFFEFRIMVLFIITEHFWPPQNL